MEIKIDKKDLREVVEILQGSCKPNESVNIQLIDSGEYYVVRFGYCEHDITATTATEPTNWY